MRAWALLAAACVEPPPCPDWPAALGVPALTDEAPPLRWAALPDDEADDEGPDVDGPFALHRADGWLFLRATAPGEGTLRGRCGVVRLRPRWNDERTGRPHPTLGLGTASTFLSGDILLAALEPTREPELLEITVDLWLVLDRERWSEGTVLEDLRGAPTPYRLDDDDRAARAVELWTAPEVDVPLAVDLVIDVDRDGRLSPGDRIDGWEGPGLVILPDLAAPGPYRVDTQDLDGPRRFWWPRSPEQPPPLVAIAHGAGQSWTSYDDLGAHLASWGAAVFTYPNPVEDIDAAAQAALSQLDRALAGDRPSGVAQLDPDALVLIGHSRGGEAVVRAVDDAVRDPTGSPIRAEQIALVSAIAPTVHGDPIHRSTPHDRPFHLLTAGADGDVTGGVLDPVTLGDCAACMSLRMLQGAIGPVWASALPGATHADFACCGTDPVLPDADLLGRATVQAYNRAVHAALLEGVVRHQPGFTALLEHPEQLLPLARDTGALRIFRPWDAFWLDDFQREPALDRASSGATVRATVEDAVEGMLDDADRSFAWDPADPMNGMTLAHHDDPARAARGTVFGWTSDARWELRFEPRDLRPWSALVLEMAQQTGHPLTEALGGPLVFDVVLVDVSGVEARISTEPYGVVPPPNPRDGGWANLFLTVRIAVADFSAAGPVDLGRIRAVRLEFGPTHGAAVGRLGMERIGLVR